MPSVPVRQTVKGGKWVQVDIDTVTFNAAISACVKRDEWVQSYNTADGKSTISALKSAESERKPCKT